MILDVGFYLIYPMASPSIFFKTYNIFLCFCTENYIYIGYSLFIQVGQLPTCPIQDNYGNQFQVILAVG